MSTSKSDDLIRAIRQGNLAETISALDHGAHPETRDDHGDPGLPLRMASFNGHDDIIRELVHRGADVNLSTAKMVGAPISLAVRGGKKETVRLLIELGAEVPPGLQTGLSLQEILAAQGIAHKRAKKARIAPPPLPGEEEAMAPLWPLPEGAQVEEIELTGCAGVDTNVLDADVMRLAEEKSPKQPAVASEERPVGAPPLDFAKFRFWKKKE